MSITSEGASQESPLKSGSCAPIHRRHIFCNMHETNRHHFYGISITVGLLTGFREDVTRLSHSVFDCVVGNNHRSSQIHATHDLCGEDYP